MKRSDLQIGTEVAVRWGSSARSAVVLSAFPEILGSGSSWAAEWQEEHWASYCTVAVQKANDGTWTPRHTTLASVLCDWPTYLERQAEEEKRKAAADEAKRAAGIARMEALLATADLAHQLGFNVHIDDWGVYIEDVFLSYLTPGGTVPEALFLRALKMIDERGTPDA